MSKINTEEWIKRAKQIHGDKYDYSKTIYVNCRTKVTIICPIHGEFEIRPDGHLRSNGCPKCGYVNIGKALRYDQSKFIEKAKLVHGDKYNYSKTNYIGMFKEITIICPQHGEFKQTPNAHVNLKEGCPECSKASRKLTTEEFIQKANLIHNNFYSYNNVIYVNSNTKVLITCPIHGDFAVAPHNHLSNKSGCPECNRSHGELEIEKYLFDSNIKYITQYEITIDNSINKSGKAYVDFYLPELDSFIEYNGRQHYIPVEKFGGQLKFEQQIKRDEYVRQYCKENNIKLLEIKFDSNIIDQLKTFFEKV